MKEHRHARSRKVQLESFKNATAGLFLMTHGQFTKNRDDLSLHGYTLAVLDEAQHASNHRTKIHKALRRLGAERTLLMTATPLNNRTDEIYNLLDLVDLPQDTIPRQQFNKRISKALESNDRRIASKAAVGLQDYTRPYLVLADKSALGLELISEHFIFLQPDAHYKSMLSYLHENLVIDGESSHATMVGF